MDGLQKGQEFSALPTLVEGSQSYLVNASKLEGFVIGTVWE
jgi:hypothetical protein